MIITVKGLIIRTADVKEADRLVTIFTEERGAVSAMAKGARSLKSRQMSATMQYCYGTYVLYQKGDMYWVREAELTESFFDIRRSLGGMALAAYICDVLCDIVTAEPEPDLLRLALNSLYAVASGRYPTDLIKAAFEMRCAAILGFMPEMLACRRCGAKGGDFLLDVMDGSLLCFSCRDSMAERMRPEADDGHESRIVCLLSEGAKAALTYCLFAPLEKLFSFQLTTEDDRRLFLHAAETYLLNHLERSFGTLDFYKEVKSEWHLT